MPTTKTGRPAATAAAATCAGTGPPPAMMVSGSGSGIVVFAGALDAPARGTERAVAARLDELDHGHHRGNLAELRADPGEPLEAGPLPAEDRLVGSAQRIHRRPVETAALEADDVEAAEAGALADRRGERDHIGGHAGEPADEGVGTDPAMLLDRGKPAEDRVLADLAMAAERRMVDHQNIVGDDAIMRHMGADHQEAFVPDDGAAAATGGAAVDRGIFADDAIAADHDRGRLVAIAGVLRLAADRGEREYPAARTDFGSSADAGMRMNDSAGAEHDVGTDHGIGADPNAFAEAGAVFDDRRRMNIAHLVSLTLRRRSARSPSLRRP